MKKRSSAVSETDAILLQVLGKFDAAWIPCRVFDNSLSVNAYLQRVSGVVPWHGGGDEEARKRASRCLDELVDAGLLHKTRIGGRTVSVALTTAGEAKARSLADMPSVLESAGIVDILSDVGDTEIDGDRWVPEDMLLPHVFGPPEGLDRINALGYLEELLLPSLIRGWVECGSTRHRNVRYRCLCVPDDEIPDGPARIRSDSHRLIYVTAHDKHRAHLASAEPVNQQEIGPIPLPVSYKGMPRPSEVSNNGYKK